MSDTPQPATPDLRELQFGSPIHRHDGVVRAPVRHVTTGTEAELVVLDDALAGPAARARFGTEEACVRELAHPGIQRWLGAGTVPAETARTLDVGSGSPFFLVEAAQGSPLGQTGVPSSWSDVELVVEGALDALAALHSRGWVHTRLSAGRILMPRRSSGGRVVLAGLSDVRRSGSRVQVTDPGPTDAPEIGVRPAPVSARTDLFGLGVAIYEYCTGERPFTTTASVPPRPLRPRVSVSRSFYLWLSKLLALDPDARFESVGDARRNWLNVSGGHAAVPEPTGPPNAPPETGDHSAFLESTPAPHRERREPSRVRSNEDDGT